MTERRKNIFKVAAHLGMTVGVFENTTSEKEFKEWIEYIEIEPLLPDRLELMIARLTEMYSAAHFKQKTSVLDYILSMTKDQKEFIKHNQLINKLKKVATRGKHGG